MKTLSKGSIMALAAAAVTAQAFAQVDFGGLTEAGGASRRSEAGVDESRASDRRYILFLSNHVQLVDQEIQRASDYAVQVVQDAEAIAAALAAERQRAEEARRRANARQVRNGVALLLGADESDVALMNSIDDLSDALSRQKDAQARADLNRRVYTPAVIGILDDSWSVADDNTLRSFDNFAVAIREGSRARKLMQREQIAQGDVAAAREEAQAIRKHIEDLQKDRTRSLALLDEFSNKYLGAVNRILAGLPGFEATFGAAKDIGFDFSVPEDSPQPLIGTLSFDLSVEVEEGGRKRTKVDRVDLALDSIGEFLEDDFRTLVTQRQRRVVDAERFLADARSGVDAAANRRTRLEAQVATERANLAAASGISNLFKRRRIQAEIDRLQGELSQAGRAAGQARGTVAEGEKKVAEANYLLKRALAAQRMLAAVQAGSSRQAVHAAYQQVRELL